MKKSTLITTIAMIVVVVVALSTATYAWFSANSFATAAVTMKTTASADWSLVVGDAGSESGGLVPYTFTSTAVDTFDATNSIGALKQGLYAPTAALSILDDSTTPTLAQVTYNTFYEASTLTTTTAKVKTVQEDVTPIVVKVSNSSGQDKTLKLVVIVNAGQAVESTGTLYAAAAFSYAIQYKTSKNAATVVTESNGYYIGAAAETTYVAINEYVSEIEEYYYRTGSSEPYTYTKDATVASSETFASSVETHGTLYKKVTGLAGDATVTKGALQTTNNTGTPQDPVYADARPTYANATAQNNGNYVMFSKATAQDVKDFGIQLDDLIIKYEITIGLMTATDSVVVAMYPWIDGWVADPSAQSAEFNVTFGFTSAA
jgi:hypothetical protein